MKVLIDADGCPVIENTIKVCRETNTQCIAICDTSHILEKYDVKFVTVSKGADSTDFALVNMVVKGDIVVTQDYGLAAISMAKGAIPLNQDGMVYTEDNIDALLQARHHAKKIRSSGGRLKGPKKRDRSLDLVFETKLREIIEENKEVI
mgnify:CR=1 FL=1